MLVFFTTYLQTNMYLKYITTCLLDSYSICFFNRVHKNAN
jgi:hypothetical protein